MAASHPTRPNRPRPNRAPGDNAYRHRTPEPSTSPDPSRGGTFPSQYEVLVTIVGRGPLRHAELAVLEGINPTMLSRIVGKLESAGLVARTQDRPTAEWCTWQQQKGA